MIILDEPYVSTFLLETARDMGIPVLDCSNVRELTSLTGLKTVNENEFMNIAKTKSPLLLYCNSENSFQWINKNLKYTEIPSAIEMFKDKVSFRKLVKDIYPHFLFKEVSYEQLSKFDTTEIEKPFIIKPTVGFFSMGVHKVNEDNEWEAIISLIRNEMDKIKGLYPTEVMNSSKFIIEEYIEGPEYAIDAYYDSNGDPVILNILEHPFSSNGDVSDRIYFTSKKIIKKYLNAFSNVLMSIGKATGISNFPVHMEVRIDKSGNVIPIEVNPMRFAGWCTTDIAYHAYGINVYENYFHQKKPDWNQILKTDDNKLYCIVVGDIPEDINFKEIKKINYDAYLSNFSNILEFRKIDYNQYPVFAFSFISVECNSNEVDKILKLDLRQYIY
ncbi:ATP-grasp domain-containing protein (plasmid) [Clostridium estertheticum]|uniref:ATP-grasp domain-containing protein n=1 Tax=Clostridium estertheticum TaxID=238834 RepID=UPI001C0D9A00|nr:ATP-grasp domain-containing protein [Clostridium estertheticum]MBU3217831.1 ATP-grasp domain-containing protein [Clostridium estertheticum]WAG58348.1 ATP-grasp domain-containing protein [Clostridium estertheticum]